MNTFIIMYLVICAMVALLVPIAKNKWRKYLSDFDGAYRDIGYGYYTENQFLLSQRIVLVKIITNIAFLLLTLLFFIFTPILLPLIAIWDKKKALSGEEDDFASFMKLYNQTKQSPDVKNVDKKAYFDSLVNLGNQTEKLSDRKIVEIVHTNQSEENTIKNLYFKDMSGGGIIRCCDCGHSEGIVSYAHSFDDEGEPCNDVAGYQCQSCGKFYALGHDDNRQCDCGGKLERDKPLFCPKCKSKNVKYEGQWIT